MTDRPEPERAAESPPKDPPPRASSSPPPPGAASGGKPPRVLIRPLPKFVFLYPTAVASLVCFLSESIGGGEEPSTRLGLFFFLVLAANLPIVAFEFSRMAIVVLGLLVGLFWALGSFAHVFGFARGLQISASIQFYAWFCILMAAMYLVVFVKTRFNYWELTSNELLHHHGLLGDVERYPAPGLRITKEVSDVFEFLLLGSGRLVIQPQHEERSLVLDSVFRVNHVENRMKELLSTLQVKMGGPGKD